MSWQPGYKKIKATPAAYRTDMPTLFWPTLDQALETKQVDNFRVRGIFQQTDGSPIAIQSTNGIFTIKQGAELSLIKIIVPDIRDIHQKSLQNDYTIHGEIY